MAKATWKKIFIELAVRAIVQVHHKYSVWELGQEKLTIDDFKRLNQGQGIFFAPEEHVRDAISQQIIETALWKEHNIQGENRSYFVDREFLINIPFKELVLLDKQERKFIKNQTEYENDQSTSDKTKNFYVDLIFKRIQIENDDETPTLPVLIEAKRFNLADIDLINKTVTHGEIQKSGIDKDILKLRVIRKFNAISKINFYGNTYDEIFTYLLIWGKGDNNKFDIEEQLINKLDYSKYIDKEHIEIRRVPLSWTNDKDIKVETFIWVALIPLNNE